MVLIPSLQSKLEIPGRGKRKEMREGTLGTYIYEILIIIYIYLIRMCTNDPHARTMFFKDADGTYDRIRTRCAEIVAERSNDQVETIQLQSAQDGSPITIRIPDPKEEEAYKVYQALPETFRNALKTGELDNLNKVLESMSVDDAETLVQVCSQYGFLDVGEQVIDETQQQQ